MIPQWCVSSIIRCRIAKVLRHKTKTVRERRRPRTWRQLSRPRSGQWPWRPRWWKYCLETLQARQWLPSLTEEVCGPACMALNLLRFHGIGFHAFTIHAFTNRHLQYVDMRWMSDKRYHTVPCEIQVHYLTSNVPCLSGLYDICNMQLSA